MKVLLSRLGSIVLTLAIPFAVAGCGDNPRRQNAPLQRLKVTNHITPPTPVIVLTAKADDTRLVPDPVPPIAYDQKSTFEIGGREVAVVTIEVQVPMDTNGRNAYAISIPAGSSPYMEIVLTAYDLKSDTYAYDVAYSLR